MISDEQLMTAIAAGDQHAVELLYDRHARLAFALALRIVGERAAAEDVVQEAFLNVWRFAGSYSRERGNVRGWLCTIVQRRALTHLRGRGAHEARELSLDVANTQQASSDTWAQVASLLDRDDVLRALQVLPPLQRATVEFAYFDGFTQTQIAGLMKAPLGTVKGRTRTALRALHAALLSTGAVPEPASN